MHVHLANTYIRKYCEWELTIHTIFDLDSARLSIGFALHAGHGEVVSGGTVGLSPGLLWVHSQFRGHLHPSLPPVEAGL